MEELNDSIRSSNAKLSTNISTMTTVNENETSVTRVTSQTINDFEPDYKWEMTTLEKASFDTPSQDTSQEQQEDNDFNSCMLNQADTQMEKVIDNIVELGGCQQFVQTLEDGGVLDKEKEVKDIEREISGEPANLDSNEETQQHHQQQDQLQQQNQEQQQQQQDTTNKQEPHEETNKIETEATTENNLMATNDSHTITEPEPEQNINSASDSQSSDLNMKEEATNEIEEQKLDSEAKIEEVPDVIPQEPLTNLVTEETEFNVKDESPIEAVESKNEIESQDEDPIVPADTKNVLEDEGEEPSVSVEPETKLELEDEDALVSDEPKVAPSNANQEEEETEAKPDEESSHSAPQNESDSNVASVSCAEPISNSVPISDSGDRIQVGVKTAKTKARRPSTDEDFIKKFKCHDCGYSTERLNNIVYHKKNSCQHFQKNWNKSVENYISGLVKSPKSNKKRKITR